MYLIYYEFIKLCSCFFLNYFKKIFWIYPFQQCILFFVSAIKNCTSSKPFNRKCVSNPNYLNHQYQELFYLVSLKPANVQFFFFLRKKLLEYKRAWLLKCYFPICFCFLLKKTQARAQCFLSWKNRSRAIYTWFKLSSL